MSRFVHLEVSDTNKPLLLLSSSLLQEPLRARAEGYRGGRGEGGEGGKDSLAGDAGSSAGGGGAGESDPNPAVAGGEEGVGVYS